jgi:hypothetical protein
VTMAGLQRALPGRPDGHADDTLRSATWAAFATIIMTDVTSWCPHRGYMV